jgi:hypothetical protein
MNKAMIQSRVLQDAMKGWKRKNNEQDLPSSKDEADVKSEDREFVSFAPSQNKKNKNSLFQVKKKKMSDREIFDSFFLSDDLWEESDDE